MADDYLLKFLMKSIGDPKGRRRWLERKNKAGMVDLAGADLTEKDLRDYDMSEVNLATAILLAADLSGVDFSAAELSFADLRRANLSNACLDRANLSSANLQEARLTDAQMEQARLSGARLGGADLIGADLTAADLTNADFRNASLKYVRLQGAKLTGADVSCADLTGSVLDDEAPSVLEHFEEAVVDDRKYRIMKSHLSVSTSLAVIPAKRQGDEPSEPPSESSKKEKGTSSWRMKGWARVKDAPEEPNVIAYVATEADLKTEEGWYRILNIEYGTPLAGVTKAFRQKAKSFHPDKVREKPPAEQEAALLQFRLARGAYEKLTAKMAKPLTHLVWVAGIPKRKTPYDYSVEEYVELAKANPRNINVLYNMAWRYFDEGMIEEAIETYERVLSLDPKDEDAEYNLRVVKLCKTFDLLPESAQQGA